MGREIGYTLPNITAAMAIGYGINAERGQPLASSPTSQFYFFMLSIHPIVIGSSYSCVLRIPIGGVCGRSSDGIGGKKGGWERHVGSTPFPLLHPMASDGLPRCRNNGGIIGSKYSMGARGDDRIQPKSISTSSTPLCLSHHHLGLKVILVFLLQ